MINISFLLLLLSNLFGSQSLQKEIPIVRWGQNSEKLTMIVSIPSIEKEEVNFNENNIYLSVINKKGEQYELNLNLLRPIIPEEPCWKRLTKEDDKNNFLIKDKSLGDANDCELAKETWFGNYKLHKRKINPRKEEKKPSGKKDYVEDIIQNLKNVHANFSLHEF